MTPSDSAIGKPKAPDQAADLIRAAEAEVAELAENFTVWVKEDLDKAVAEFERAKVKPDDNEGEIRKIFTVCHDVKGQAGSFGYSLMTEIGGSLCDTIRDGGGADEEMLKVIEGHLKAMKFIVDRDITGDGGDVGQKLLHKLRQLARQVS